MFQRISFGLLNLANNLAQNDRTGTQKLQSTCLDGLEEVSPHLTSDQLVVREKADLILAKVCSSGVTIEGLCDPLMTESETAPEFAKVTGFADVRTVRQAVTNEKALMKAKAEWENRARKA